jgi:RNA polymerase sigma-70 factor (ECF subfamily)
MVMAIACNESIPGMERDEGTVSIQSALPPAPRLVNTEDQPEPSPEQLARRSQAGCPESFEQLLLRYEAPVFNFLHQLTRNRQDAEDLTQETFLRAYRSLFRYNPSQSFATWLFTIARRAAVSHFRAATQFEELPEDDQAEEADPAKLLESQDEQNSIWRRARTLKPKQFEVLWLRYQEGFSVAETARIMRTNQIHVKVLLHRARANLSEMLAARGMASLESGNRTENKPRTIPPLNK